MAVKKTSLPRGFARQIKALNAITTGPAAVVFPAEVKALELKFRTTSSGVPAEVKGAFDFWKQKLPPVQFYNSSLPISVIREEAPSNEALELSFQDGQLKQVSIVGKTAEEIFAELVSVSKATPVPESDLVEIKPKA